MPTLPAARYHVSRKVDGEFNLLEFDGTTCRTVNPGGTVRTGLPLHAEAAQILSDAGISKASIVGELYANRADRRARVTDIMSISRAPQSDTDLDNIRFAAFDLVDINGEAPASYEEAWSKIRELLIGGFYCQPVGDTDHRFPRSGIRTVDHGSPPSTARDSLPDAMPAYSRSSRSAP